MPGPIRFTSSQAPNADRYVRAILNHLAERLSLPIEWVDDGDWLARERDFDAGRIHMAWVCGLPYVWKADDSAIDVELLAAPVLAAPRYRSQPIYFSDVIVRHDSPYQSFEDLRGASWAINEPRSHSGYNITRHHLATLGHHGPFFSRVRQAGAHEIAIRLVARGRVDASAIDSSVLETEYHLHPDLHTELRLIAALGPSPIPPWVVHRSLDAGTRAALRQALLSLHTHPAGRALLAEGALSHFSPVTDADYDPIRQMERQAAPVTLARDFR